MIALVPVAALGAIAALTFVLYGNASSLQPPWVLVGAPAFLALVLHPAGREFFDSFRLARLARLDRLMLALVLVATAPLLTFAARNVRLQGTVPDDHSLMGHYGVMAAFGVTVVGIGVLASLLPQGWRLTASVTGLLPVLLGVTSLVYPDASSSLGLAWSLASIGWGAIFVGAAERARRRQHATVHGVAARSDGRA